jgi:hypothetical protein
VRHPSLIQRDGAFMDERRFDTFSINTRRFAASIVHRIPTLSLRYFDANGAFAWGAGEIFGRRLPDPLEAWEITEPPVRIAWRSPTETLLLGQSAEFFGAFDGLASSPDGCVVDMTGAFSLIRCSGTQVGEVIARLGGPGILPGRGQARRGRFAELPALALCVRNGEYEILIEHDYADHLTRWIGQAVANVF